MKQQESSNGNFLSRLFASLFGNNDPEAEKRRQLKNIAKELAKTHTRYYKAGSDEVTPALAKFFYDLYKAVAPAQALFQNVQNNTVLRNLVIDYSLNERQHALIDNISEENIRSKAKTVPLQELTKNIKQMADQFMAEFDVESIDTINGLYTNLIAFKSFCSFDYYFLLKKFDSSLREREFNTAPRFEKINAEYVGDDLKDFLSVVYELPEKADWSSLLKLFRNLKGIEPVPLGTWNKILSKLENMKRSQVFEMLIQLITKDPNWVVTVTTTSENVIDPYLQKINTTVDQTLRNLAMEEKNSKVDKLLVQIFGTTVILQLKNYTEQTHLALMAKNVGGYAYYQPLNYMKAFLIEFVKKDIREYADLVLIRGEWATTALSTPMSEAYHSLLELSTAITEFDKKLAEDGEIGTKIKTLLPRSARDREARNIIHTLTSDANSDAYDFLVKGTKDLITIAKTIKTLIEDYTKKTPDLIINWKELEHFAEHPINELGVQVYKRIYLFVALMQNFLSKK